MSLLLPFLFVVSACSATDEIKATFIPTSRNLTSAEVIADSESKLEAASGFEFSNGKLGIDPDQIRIPAIGVDAKVIDLELNPDHTLEVPEDFSETGWWTGSSKPGRPGPAVIVGHLDSKTSSAVFYRL